MKARVNSRRKGHNWERRLAQMFREAMPGAEIRRGLQSRGGGKEAADVECPVFHVEAKCGRLPNVRAAMRQAKADAEAGKIPLAVVKDDRAKPFVVVELDDFLEFVRQWWMVVKHDHIYQEIEDAARREGE